MSERSDHAADPVSMRQAVAALLEASGLSTDDPELRETPRRVAELWQAEFLAGYQHDPATILGATIPTKNADAVVTTHLAFHGLCPHHLLPMQGLAHLAYLPAERVVGFGQLAKLVQCFTQRLVLQEHATSAIAQALVDHLDARGAGCVLVARHSCLSIPNDRHRDATVVTSSFLGALEGREDIRTRLLSS